MNKIKGLSAFLLGIAIAIGIIFIIAIILKGGISFVVVILPWIQWISSLTILVNFLIFLPLSFFKKTREASAVMFYISAYIFGIEIWMWSLLITYSLWGGFWVVIGLLLGGIGVVLMALLATFFIGSWFIFLSLLFGMTIVYGVRKFAFYLSNKVDNENYNNKIL